MDKKILVTGGTGYIGSHTIIDLIQNGFNVICVDNGINSDRSSLDAVKKITGVDVPYYCTDLCNKSETEKIFIQNQDIEGIIHFAALKSVGESVEKPILYFRNNLESLINILEFAIKYNIKAFVFSSSCTVYGNVQKSPVDEQTEWQEAASPYGRTKQIGEQIIRDSFKNTEVQNILLRYFNPAGAHPSALIGESPINPPQNLVPVITETAIGKRKEMTVFGTDYPTRDGSCIRDYIHICDLAHAHTLSLKHIFGGSQLEQTEVFNVGIGNGLSVLEIIESFEKQTGQNLNYTKGPRRPGDVMAIFSDFSKAKNILGWEPKYDVNDIVSTAWEWEKNRSALK